MNDDAIEHTPLPTPKLLIFGTVWIAAAILAERLRLLDRLPLPFVVPPIVIALLILHARSRPLRLWFRTHIRAVLLFHGVRFVGFYFLLLYRVGELPFAFAVPAGIGDVYAAAAALLSASVYRPAQPLIDQKKILFWNAFGLLDILSVVGTAAFLSLTEPASIAPLWHLPLSLLPTVVVPLVIASHIAIFLVARRERQPVVVRY